MCVSLCVFVRVCALGCGVPKAVVSRCEGIESIGKSQKASKLIILPARQLQQHLERKTFGTKNAVLAVETAEIGLG